MEGPGPHLHVVGLQDHAALGGPEPLQLQDQALEAAPRVERCRGRGGIGRRCGGAERYGRVCHRLGNPNEEIGVGSITRHRRTASDGRGR